MSDRVNYTTLSIYPKMADRVVKIKDDLGLKSNNEAVQVLLVAYDILNNTGYGGRFTEAVKSAMEDDKA